MLEQLTQALSKKKNRDLAMLAVGTAGFMGGAKLGALSIAARGLVGLEEEWRKAHPDFDGDLMDRWDRAIAFYDETHQDPTNRLLHTIGIPMIVGGALGMLAAPRWTPPWWMANGSWTAGWVLNFVGHGYFEKGAPAFADDPLSFVAGPVWDFVRIKDKLIGKARGPVDAPPPTPVAAAA